jgi:hypothetical protein
VPPSSPRSRPYSRAGLPSPTPTQGPTPDSGTSAAARTFESGSATTTICLLSAKIDPDDRVARRHQHAQPKKSGLAVAVTPGDSIAVAHSASSSANRDIKPDKRIRRTFLRRAPTRRTSLYAVKARGDRRVLARPVKGERQQKHDLPGRIAVGILPIHGREDVNGGWSSEARSLASAVMSSRTWSPSRATFSANS